MTTATHSHDAVAPQTADILFCVKARGTQRLVGLAGGTHRHVGIVAAAPTGWTVIDVGRVGHRTRTLAEFLGTYDRVDIIRLVDTAACLCPRRIIGAAHGLRDRIVSYPANRHLFLSGLIATTRGRLPIRSAVRAVADLVARVPVDPTATLCSSFALQALAACCDRHRPRIDLSSLLDDTTDREPGALERAHALPDDIRRALLAGGRARYVSYGPIQRVDEPSAA